MEKFYGIIPALITPFTENGKINEKALQQIVKINLEKGVSGFYVGGSTGESFLMTTEERKTILEIVSHEAKGKAKIIAHIGSIATDHALELSRHAAELQVDAISSLPPFYYKFSLSEIKSYYLDIVNEVSLPMIIYNIPALTGVSFTSDNIGDLLEDTRIMGVKYTSHDLFQMQRMLQEYPEVTVFNGHDEVFLGGLAMGAKSAIGSTFNFMAEKFIRIQKLYEAGKLDEARNLQAEANQIISILIKVGVFQGVKEALKMMGIPCGECRRPFKKLDNEERNMLQKVLSL
ncbi:MAG: N-acetylneuraminate lyase [Bacillota bacterium]